MRNIDNEEELRELLRKACHESNPNLYACYWMPRDENSVYLFYHELSMIVSGNVVYILGSLPPRKLFGITYKRWRHILMIAALSIITICIFSK